ncbi:MAG: two-component system response regulator [Hyphomonadaceae bacterium]
MNVKTWTVCLVEPNKYEGQIILDLLRNAGVDRVKVFTDPTIAMESLEAYNANVVIASFEMTTDGASWTRQFRRNRKLANRRSAVFITSSAFSRSMAEECRHAGANALIGKPISAKVLLATITKVLAAPREFIDGEGYVGPCRRAGIVTAGAPRKRRKADDAAPAKGAAANAAITLEQAVEALAAAAAQYLNDPRKLDGCEAALRFVQAYAVNAGDGPLMRACAAFALQLTSGKNLRPEAARAALDACVSGVVRLAATPRTEAAEREKVAEGVRQAVAKAAMQRAA